MEKKSKVFKLYSFLTLDNLLFHGFFFFFFSLFSYTKLFYVYLFLFVAFDYNKEVVIKINSYPMTISYFGNEIKII